MPSNVKPAAIAQNSSAACPIMTVAEFHQALDALHGQSSRYENFIHFLELSYSAWAQCTARTLEQAKALDERHRVILDQYGDDRESVSKAAGVLFAKLIDAIAGYHGDFLGDAYAAAGFDPLAPLSPINPYTLARIEAQRRITRAQVVRAIAEETPLLLPTALSGSGLMVLAAADCVYSYGFDPSTTVFAVVCESDVLGMQMSFLQMSFKALAGLVIRRDASSGQELERAVTFAGARMLGYPIYRSGEWPPVAQEVAKWDAQRQQQFAAIQQQENDNELIAEYRTLRRLLNAVMVLNQGSDAAASDDPVTPDAPADSGEEPGPDNIEAQSELLTEPEVAMNTVIELSQQHDMFG